MCISVSQNAVMLQKTGAEEHCEELFIGDCNYSVKVRVLGTKHLGDSLET